MDPRQKDPNYDVTTEMIFKMLAGELLPSDVHKARAEKHAKKVAGRKQWKLQEELEAYFETLNTRELIAMHKMAHRHLGDIYTPFGDFRYSHGSPAYHAMQKVLARRPHLPKKPERRLQRQLAATQSHGPKKLRDRLKETQKRRAKEGHKAAERKWAQRRQAAARKRGSR